MLKPERVTFSADDDQFHQFTTTDQLDSFLNNSLVHYSTEFKKAKPKELPSIRHSNSLDEASSIAMSSQDHQQQQQQQQTEHEPAASAPPSLISDPVPLLDDNNLHQLDALALQQLAVGSNQTLSNINEDNTQRSPSHPASLADIQKEVERVKRMKYGRTYSSSPTSSLCSRLTTNPFNGSNNNVDLSSLTHSVHFTDKANPANRLPFSSSFITSIPESIVPASSGAASTNDNHFIPIDHIESPSLEDREVFETFHTKQTAVPGVAIRQSTNALNRNASPSETDLLASLHRSASKQAIDAQSDHDTTYSGTSDDMIFVEWDKERSLFQDYINSLRTEIRVLLQERSDYQSQMETINSNLSEHKRLNSTQVNQDQTKFDLLQKSLEEKNLVLEQIQKEYENMKEKNSNLNRKVSNLRCDGKAQTGVIDELKQKIAELTVDIQNHVLVKRRLEISVMNLEGDCKILDGERMRLNNDIKETNLSKQELEKLLQQANVQIAEQGSTIEMLRSDNIQIRSQLSANQRRMLQEKQQVMDYLRQIENDLVEKEQIKQRESILRKDYEKLQKIHQHDRQEIDQMNLQINQDKQKLAQLEEERVQLLKTIGNFDHKQMQLETELDAYKSGTKRLYTHFRIPFDSIQSIDQLIPMLEDRYRAEQISQARIHQVPLVQSTPQINNQQETEEIRRLREDLASTNIQVKQLDEANQAWQQYQQNQLVLLRDRLEITDTDNLSFEDIVQQIENRLTGLNDQLTELQDHRTETDVAADELRQRTDELQNMTRQSRDTQTDESGEYQRQRSLQENPIENVELNNNQQKELRQLRENLAGLTAQCAQLDEVNQAWQQYHQTELDSFRDKLRKNLSIDNNLSLDGAAQAIVAHLNQLDNEHENLLQQLQTSEKLSQELRAELLVNDQTVQQTSANTINELNGELRLLKQQNDQLETEKYILNQQLEKQSPLNFNQERNTPTPDSTTSDSKSVKKYTQPAQINEAQIHNVTPVQSASPLTNEQEQELQQLRQNLTLLTDQCAQLDEANRAWQLYQQTQLDTLRNTLQDHLPLDQTSSIEQAAQQIIDQISKERNDFTQQYLALEKANEELRSESTDYSETIDELNQQLLATTEKTQQAQVEVLRNQLKGCLSVDYDGPLNEIAQQIVDQVTREREDFSAKHQALERANNDLRSESNDNMQAMQETHTNTVNQLNQDLLALQETCERLDTEKRSIELALEQLKQSNQKAPSNTLQQLFEKVPIHAGDTNTNRETEELQQLRENVAAITAQCAQLDEANHAWQLYQQTQLDNFQTKLHDHVPVDGTTSFDEIAEQIIHQLTSEKEDLESIRQSYLTTVDELNQKLLAMKQAYDHIDNEKQLLTNELERQSIEHDRDLAKRTTENASPNIWRESFKQVPIHGNSADVEQNAEEIRQLRESVATLTAQCAQLDEANRVWPLYQQRQVDDFRTKLHECLSIDENASLEQIAKQIADQLLQEREDFSEKYQALESANHDLQSNEHIESVRRPCINTINELNQELLAMKEAYDHLNDKKQVLANELDRRSVQIGPGQSRQTFVPEEVSSDPWKLSFAEVPIHTSWAPTDQDAEELQRLRENVAALTVQCAQFDEASRAWQQYHQTQANNLRNKLIDHVPIDDNASLDQLGQQIIDQITKEREDFNDRFSGVENTNEELRSESDNTLEAVKQSYMNAIKGLNQELLAMKDAYDQLDAEKQHLVSELEKQSLLAERDRLKQTTENVPSNMWKEPFNEVPIHTSGTDAEQDTGEVQQLRENVAALTAQCTQLDEASRAWQQYHQTQVDNLRNKLIDHVPIDDNASLDQLGQQIIDQITKEREDFNDRFSGVENTNEELRSESDNTLEAVKQSYMNAIKGLNQELLTMKDAYDQLDAEKQHLISELEKQALLAERDRLKQTTENVPSNMWREPFNEVPIHTSGTDVEQDTEVQQLRENVAALTAQCAQFDEASRAWQLYHQTQVDNLRNKLVDHVPIDENASLDQLGQQIINQIANERQNFNDRFLAIENANEELRSESDNTVETVKQSYMNAIKGLNQELLTMKDAYDQLNAEKQHLISELEKQALLAECDRLKQTTEKVPSNMWKEPFNEVPIHTSAANVEQDVNELQQLRENVAALTAQCAQFNEASRAWQQYHQTQVDNLRDKLINHVPIDENASLDQLGQQIIDQITKEREDFNNRFSGVENANEELRSESSNNLETMKQSYMNAINDLNQELLAMKDAYGQLEMEKQNLIDELEKQALLVDRDRLKRSPEKVSSNMWKEPFKEVPIHAGGTDVEQDTEVQQLRDNVAALTAQCAQFDEASRAWQQYHQTQVDNLRNKLIDHVPIDENASLDQLGQQIINQIANERQNFNDRFLAIENANEELRSESDNTLETVKQSYMNAIKGLNQELLTMKDAYDQLDAEKQNLIDELEKQSLLAERDRLKQTTENVPSNMWKEPFNEVPIHTSGTDAEQDAGEVQQLRENVAALTAQCTQLDEASRAWQRYHQTQVDNLRKKLIDHVPIDDNASLDLLGQQVINQITKEREDFNNRFSGVENPNEELRSESADTVETVKQSYMNTINDLNQELLAMKDAYDQLNAEKQNLIDELEKQSLLADRDRLKRSPEKVSSNMWKEPFKEVPIHTSGADAEEDAGEVQQLRENVAALTAQCAQLEEANRSWQSYQQVQLNNFRTKLNDHVDVGENASLDDLAEQIIHQITKEREEFTDNLRSGSAIDLETIKQSYMNTVVELNQELLAIKEAYKQIDEENQALMNTLGERPVNTELSPVNLSDEVPLQTSGVNTEQESDELQQLREKFSVLTAQFAQLNEANQAWKGYHQSQLDNFCSKVQDCIEIDDDSSFDQLAQQIVDQITKEREEFTEQYQALEKTNHNLHQSDSMEENKNYLSLKEQYEKILGEKEQLILQIENQAGDKETIESTNSTLLEQQTEMSQLRENLRSLTAQFDEANRSWDQFERTQIDLLKTLLPYSMTTSLEDIIEEIISHINHLTEEIHSLKEKSNDDEPTQDFAILQSQYTQLDNANRAWQTFYDGQMDLLKDKFQNHIPIDDNLNFEQIIQSIATQLDSNETDQLKQQLNELQETNNLLINTNQNLTDRLNQVERPSSPFVSQENFKQIRRTPIQEVQIHQVTPVQSASSSNIGDEELEQLRNNLSALTAQCAQLDQANHAWQEYHQNQLEAFRKELEDWIFLDGNSTLEQIGKEIILQFDRLANGRQNEDQSDSNATIESLNKQIVNYQLNESTLAQNLEQLKQQLDERQEQNDFFQAENQQLQAKCNELERRPSLSAFQRVDIPRENAAIHHIDANREQEMQQLRDDLAAALAHCLQLEEANRAWQKYQYDQIESFRQNLQEKIPTFNQMENPSVDSIAEQVMQHLDQLNNQRDYLLQQNDSLKDEIRLQKKELERPNSTEGAKRSFRRLSQDKQVREAQVHNVAPVQSASPLTHEQEQELQQLRQNLTLLTEQCAQLDEANRAWQLYQQTQLDTLRNALQDHLPLDQTSSIEQAAQQIIDQISKERNDFTQQYLALEKANEELRSESTDYIETIDELNQQLLAIKEKTQPTNDTATSADLLGKSVDVEEIGVLRENVASLTAQLDESNRAWKEYQQAQVNMLRDQLEGCLSVDCDGPLNEIAQQIVDQVTREREDFNAKYQALERANNDLQPGEQIESIRQSYTNTINELNQQLNEMKDAYDQLDAEKQNLISELEKQSLLADRDRFKRTTEKVSSNMRREPFNEVPIHTSSADVEQDAGEVQQLRDNVAALSAQCADFEEASRAWQLYHQTQLNNFRSKLHDHLTVDEHTSLDDIAQQIIDQMTKELDPEMTNTIPSTEQPSTEIVDELTVELSNLRNQYEELEKMNQQLLLEKEFSNDRSIVVGHHSAHEPTVVEEDTPIDSKEESTLQSSSIPTETEEIRQIRSDLASITSQLTELTQSNENELNSFRNKLQDWISLPTNSTLDDIADQLNTHFDEQQPPETTHNETQTLAPSDKNHIATETTLLTYANHQTQIDPIDTIDQQIQTESFLHIWSMSNDDNLFNSNEDDDRLRDYIDEIKSLSPLDLSHRLMEKCEQILSKQNFDKTYEPNLDLNHLALITIYSLYQQHLGDDAKQLYNDTVIRALRQEYELINDEKNDYMEKYLQEIDSTDKKLNQLQNQYDELLEQNELERFDGQKSLDDLKKTLEFQLANLQQENEQLKSNFKNLEENNRQIKDQTNEQLENEYQQLREDYNELINQNELLKEYNSQMYQNKLQGYDRNACDIEIQCNLMEENRSSSDWPNNDWDKDNTNPDLPIQEQGSEKLSNEEETNRLKALIEEIQLENQYLKELNSQNVNAGSISNRPVCVDNYAQTESEKEPTEDNDWNVQFSPFEIPSEQPNSSSEVNNQLQGALQTIKAKIHQAVTDRPELFPNVGEDTLERLDHFISTIENQATHIDHLQNECQLAQEEIDQLRSALEAYQSKIDNEGGLKTEPLLSAAPPSDDTSQSMKEDHEQPIKQLQQKLSQNEDERSLLRERLNEVELEYREAIEDRASTIAMYEEQLQSLIQERNALVEQQQVQAADSQQEIEQLQQQLLQIRQASANQPLDAPSDEEIQSLKDDIEQKSQELKDVSEKYLALSSQYDTNADLQAQLDRYKQETEERMTDYENQIEDLTRERARLLDEIQKNTTSSLPAADIEKQAKMNTKLKRALQGLKEKINRVVTDRPDLFGNIGEETSERLDHLISTVEHQATQIDMLQAERNEVEEQLRDEIRELQGSVEANQYQIENERPIQVEQLLTAAPSSDTISQSPVEDHEQQVKQLQQKLSQNEDERSLLRERLNEVELEFRKTIDDHASTIAMYEEQLQSLAQERNALAEQDAQAADSQREIEQLQEELVHLKQTPVTSNEDVRSLQQVIQQQADEVRDLNEKYFALASQMDAQEEFDQQKRETEQRLQNYENQIQNLIREHASLLDQVENKPSSPVSTTDNESQTEDQQHDKLAQVNTKLKRALQILKEKIHRIVTERPDLFNGIGEETSERLEHLITIVGHQATQLDNLQTERDQSEAQLHDEIQELRSSLEASQYQLANENPMRTEELITAAPSSDNISPPTMEDHVQQIKQLQQKLSHNEDERSLLRERLNEVELEFREAIEDRASTIALYEEQLQSLIQERNALVEEQQVQATDSQHEIEQLQQQLAQMEQALANQPLGTNADEEIQSLKDDIEQKSQELKDVSEKYLALSAQSDTNTDLQAQLDKYKQETEERLTDYENQIEDLTRERARLLDEIQKNTTSSLPAADIEKQAKMNTKLKRALQGLKEKINRVVTDRPDLFGNIGEETSERLDHLISTVEHQATQIDMLQAERNEVEEQLRDEIRELQGSLEANQYQIENERPIRAEQLLNAAPSSDTISQPTVEDHEQQVKQLQQKLSQNEDERSLLRERLNEVELEFRKTIDDHASTIAMYEEQLQSLAQERNALVEQQQGQSGASQYELEQLQDELTRLRQSDNDIQSLNAVIEQKSEQLKDLNDKYIAMVSQLQSQAEHENQIEHLTRERARLLDEIQKSSSSPVPAADTEKQAKMNTKLKRALQTFKEKINRVVTDRPDLFANIGEETSERLDHLISIVEHQATQIGVVQTEHNEVEEQLRDEIRELQGSVEAYRYQIENERVIRTEQLLNTAPSSDTISQSPVEDYEKQIKQLQKKLSQNEDERSLLRERLNEVELEFRKTIDDHASTIAMYEEQLQSLTQERNALVEQQQGQPGASQYELEQLQNELTRLRQSDNDIQSLNAIIEQKSEQLKDLNDKYIAMASQLQSQAEHENQIEHLTRERARLLDEIQKSSSSPLPTADTEKQAKINTKLKRALQGLKEKLNRIVTDRPDLFGNIGEETSERLDYLISTVEHQARQIEILQAERNEIEKELQNSLELHRQQLDGENRLRALPSASALVHQTETPSTDASEEIQPLQTSNDNQWNDWSTDSPHQTDATLDQSADGQAPSVANRLFGFLKNVTSSWAEETPTNDWDAQNSPFQLPAEEPQQTILPPSSIDQFARLIENKIQEIISEFPNHFPNSNEDILNSLDRFASIIRNLESQIEELQNTLVAEENQKPIEIQTTTNPSTSANQRISRRVFEQEMLAWSKESERLKDFVKQIQIENKKLKDIILKFEPIMQDYMHENERLKEENQQFSFLSDPSTIENPIASDTDICYLTLKWLTYEVAQRASDPNEPSLLLSENYEPHLRQRLNETERQLRNTRLHNEKLKKQFKYIQHEINTKNQELAALKIELDKLRASETQYRLEVDRVKVDLQCDQVKYQQLERELADLKFERTNLDDTSSTNNLRELLELKERELHALKEKLDYTIQAHQLELQEAIKANQFSLDNVQRFEQLDQRNQEKRKELETRLGKICRIVRPLIDNQYLFREESMINMDELEQLVTDTEAEERVLNSLGPIRDCLGLLESQMKELQDNLIENHARRSKRSKDRSDFDSSSNNNQWTSTHPMQETPDNSDFFLVSSSSDLMETDVRLCLDDILDEIIVRTTAK